MNLSLPQLSVLAYAASRERITARDAAAACSLDPDDAREAVEALAADKLLYCTAPNRRTRAYVVTPKGHAALAVIAAQAQQETEPS